MQTNTIPDIKSLVTELVSPKIQETRVTSILDQIHASFYQLTQMNTYSSDIKYLAAVPTASGMALSLNHAAECFLDYKRTWLFLKGIVTAIQKLLRESPDQTVHIFYAGCGPYAPFINLVAPLFKPSEIQFSILEINQHSLSLAKKLITSLSLTSYIKSYYEADAVTFTIPSPEDYQILFSETLDALLYRESYVPILQNMLTQFSNDIIVIPHNVSICMNYISVDSNNTQQETYAGIVFDTREALVSSITNETSTKQLPSQSFDIVDNQHYKGALLDTEVHIYQDLKLYRNESSLTLPYEVSFDPDSKIHRITFTYVLQPQVELRCDFNTID